jgi:protein O-GlcNAc transferase
MTGYSPEQLLAAAAEHFQQRRLNHAEAFYRKFLESRPGDARALMPLGFVCYQLRRPYDSLALFAQALETNPGLDSAHVASGYLLLELNHAAEALKHFGAALRLRPGSPDALKGQGTALARVRRHDEAIASYEAALIQAPTDPEIHYNLGNSLLASGHSAAALVAYDRAIELRPQLSGAWNNRGAALLALNRVEEALSSFKQAVGLSPRFAEALHNLGDVLTRAGLFDEALNALERALAVDPEHPYTQGIALSAGVASCDWRTYEQRREAVLGGVSAGRRIAVPLLMLLASNAPEQHVRCARIWVADRFPAREKPLWRGAPYGHKRIRLAYLSGDFHEHPVAYSIAGVIERHDRDRFECFGISFRADQQRSAMRARLERAFDRFIDVSSRSDPDVATLLRELEVDIAIDLMGHTEGSRMGILAFRPAPLQVSYLGYPGSLGAPYIDYILADPIALPERDRGHLNESIVHMPGCYLPSDHRQLPAAPTPTRHAAGLPASGFVFCAFNNTSKITPEIFAIWMRLLRQVPGSVLWLSARNRSAAENLRKYAEQLDVSADRLIFASRMPQLEAHLARHRLADLFLDTSPYNAHTTAADALWAGVPIVTCKGATMAGRAGASLLAAAGLESLVTDSLAAYERQALQLADDASKLAEIRAHLADQRTTGGLFDTDRYRADLESAYTAMWGRLERGEPPDLIRIVR